MKKVETPLDDEMRPEYGRSDLGKIVRGKYAEQMKKGSNIVILDPRVARAFPTSEAVNQALLSLLDLAQRSVRVKK